jgi:hypothetical protein
MDGKILSKGEHYLGKLSRNGDKRAPRNCKAYLSWELRERADGRVEFSATGDLWNHLKTDIVWGGQCVDQLAALFPHDKRARRIKETWAKYHLNGMHAGTVEQEVFVRGLPEDVQRDYEKKCAALKDSGLYEVPLTPELAASALGGMPEGATTYKYGTRWLYEPIPEEVLTMIRNGFQTTPTESVTPEPDDDPPTDDLWAQAALTMRVEFVPWSRSLNAKEKHPSLNWRITLERNGREIVTADYSQGSGWCPANKIKGGAYEKREAIKAECEQGKPMRVWSWGIGPVPQAKPLVPSLKDVVHSLLIDADVLRYSSFEDWADNFGYDADSLKAKGTYDSCLHIALKLRGALGGELFEKMLEANS